MKQRMWVTFGLVMAGLLMASMATPVDAYEITDSFSINGVLSGAYQYQWVEDDADGDRGRGAQPFKVELDFKLT